MPTSPPMVNAGDIIQVKYLYTAVDQKCMNVFQLQVGPSAPTQSFVTFANALNSFLSGPTELFSVMNAYQFTDTINYSNTIQIIKPTRYYLQSYTGLQNGQRTTGAGAAPPNVAATFWRGPFAVGRGKISHTHFGGLSLGDIDGGVLKAGLTAALNQMATLTVTPIALTGGTTLTWIALNRVNPGNSLELFTTGVNPYVRVQRRRTVGVGK